MFALPENNNRLHVLADYIECHALESAGNECSIASLRAAFAMHDDEINLNGVEEGDDRAYAKLDEALQTCASRKTLRQNDYPYVIDGERCVLKEELSEREWIYIFLLLATRMNMQTQRVQGGADATQLFEHLCKSVAHHYFGEHSNCIVMGTANNGSFKDKFIDLLNKLNIDGKFQAPQGWTNATKDGGVDIVAWLPFADKKDSQLIALGQCKTGTTWDKSLKKQDIFRKFSTRQPMASPVYMFFVAESMGTYKWEENSIDAGIVFDRQRIMEYLPDQPEEALLQDIRQWINAALLQVGCNREWK